MDSKKESIRKVVKFSNTFELLKSPEGYSVQLNGRELAFTKYEDIANVVFTHLIAKF